MQKALSFPSVLIFKGVRENPAFSNGLPPGSQIYMNPKSSYISSELFSKWLKEHFFPRKPPGKVLLVLDGHSTHRSSLDMLEFAEKNDIILLCLPSHTTQALQPLDRAFFKPFKTNYRRETNQWVVHNPKIPIKRVHAAMLISNAWGKSASVENCLSGFKATGIFPLNRNAIPDHFFNISDISQSRLNRVESVGGPDLPTSDPASVSCSRDCARIDPQPSTSSSNNNFDVLATPEETSSNVNTTPSKILHNISPVPKVQRDRINKRKQSARILDNEFILEKKKKNAQLSYNDRKKFQIPVLKKLPNRQSTI